MTDTIKYVQLGRFAPIHKGHQMISGRMAQLFGIENCLGIIGSYNAELSEITPFTFDERYRWFSRVVPGMKIIGLPDINPTAPRFQGQTVPKWLDSVEALARSRGERFIFCGGSENDIGYLSGRFETMVLIDRDKAGQGISATLVRQMLESDDITGLAGLIDARILDEVVEIYRKNMKLIFNL